MNRSTMARRYAPLAALAAIQLLIIATVPSTASKKSSQLSVSTGNGNTAVNSGAAGATDTSGGTATDTGGGTSASSGGTSGGGTTSGGTTGGVDNSGGGGGAIPPGVESGDTSHCVGGREFAASIAYFGPPCVPGKPGATNISNGGATSMGVTANKITIVDYNGDPGAEVDAILKAQGLYESYQNAQVLDKAYEKFINKMYVLYGRQLNIVTYQGQCQTVPPQTNCLIPEMDKIAAQYHPYAVFWNTTLCSQCFAELARDKVVTFGASGFSDDFANQNAPYFYAYAESATRIENAFAEFYCKQLAHSPVKYAGTGNPSQNFNGQKRELGIISTNDPDNQNTVEHVLVPALKACGVNVTHFYYYAQDINTAAQQTAAGIARMDTPTNPATSVLCLCDSVAPQFLYEGEKENNYFPENLQASDQGMDLDKAAQSYESGISCVGGPPCEFDVAFGVNPDGPGEPSTNNAGTRIYALGGGTNLPVDPTINLQVAQNYVMFANLLENTGPNLTPQNMQARAPSLGAVGGGATGQALLQFAANDWSWQQDARVAFWSPRVHSSYNGSPGTYISIEGNRYNLGEYPTMTEPPIPNPRP
jgi:hypothetical protein